MTHLKLPSSASTPPAKAIPRKWLCFNTCAIPSIPSCLPPSSEKSWNVSPSWPTVVKVRNGHESLQLSEAVIEEGADAQVWSASVSFLYAHLRASQKNTITKNLPLFQTRPGAQSFHPCSRQPSLQARTKPGKRKAASYQLSFFGRAASGNKSHFRTATAETTTRVTFSMSQRIATKLPS